MTDQHTGAARLTEAEFRALYDRLRAMPDWGPQDRRGALNYLTPDLVAAAPCRDVRLGRSVSMAAELADVAAPDNPEPVTHELGTAGPDGGGSMGDDASGVTGGDASGNHRGDAARTAGLDLRHRPVRDERARRREQSPGRAVPRDVRRAPL